MTGHTPGPWFHYDDSESVVHRHDISATGKTIARIYCTKGNEDIDAANAHLIAAAPALLEALEHIAGNTCYCAIDADGSRLGRQCDRCVAHAAIAKAQPDKVPA